MIVVVGQQEPLAATRANVRVGVDLCRRDGDGGILQRLYEDRHPDVAEAVHLGNVKVHFALP
jgi:hypothetical protein